MTVDSFDTSTPLHTPPQHQLHPSSFHSTPSKPFQLYVLSPVVKVTHREVEQPTLSILKSPTTLFDTYEHTPPRQVKRLRFDSNSPIDLQETNRNKESSPGSNRKVLVEEIEYEIGGDGNIEVAVSPSRSVRVSPEAWRAQLEYHRRFRDYPNEMEKTDYTYSYKSKYHNQEIIPGFTIKPNMSRRPLSSVRGSSMSSDTTTSTLTREELNNIYNKYLMRLANNSSKHRMTSVDEVDYNINNNNNHTNNKSHQYESLFRTTTTTESIRTRSVAALTTLAAFVMFVPRWFVSKLTSYYRRWRAWRITRVQTDYYYDDVEDTWSSRFYRAGSNFRYQIINIIKKTFITSTTYYNNTNVARAVSTKSKRRWLWWLLLPLLLLLAGWCIQQTDLVPEPSIILHSSFTYLRDIWLKLQYFVKSPSLPQLPTLPTLEQLYTTLIAGIAWAYNVSLHYILVFYSYLAYGVYTGLLAVYSFCLYLLDLLTLAITWAPVSTEKTTQGSDNFVDQQ